MSIVGVLCLCILLILYYRWVQDDFWEARKKIVQQVTTVVEFDEVLRAERFQDDETLWVITGIDFDGEEQMAWWDGTDDELLFVTSPEEGISRKDAQQKVLSDHPNAKIMRVLPARYEGSWAWEVFYKYPEETNQTRYAYDYYGFEDGKHLGTLNLAPEKEH